MGSDFLLKIEKNSDKIAGRLVILSFRLNGVKTKSLRTLVVKKIKLMTIMFAPYASNSNFRI